MPSSLLSCCPCEMVNHGEQTALGTPHDSVGVKGDGFALVHQGADAEARAQSRLPDTQPGPYLREHISSKLFPHQLIKKKTLREMIKMYKHCKLALMI